MAERKLFFDEKNHAPDAIAVADASALLQVTEFELFRIAYRWWHGDSIPDDELEPIYLPYMFRDQVPSWVRQFCREVLDRADAGELDPLEYGIEPRPLDMGMYNRGLRYFLWLVIVLGSLVTAAQATVQLMPWYQSCTIPPCF